MINIYRFKISSFDKQKMSALRPIRIVAGPTDQSFQITPPPSLLIVVAVGPPLCRLPGEPTYLWHLRPRRAERQSDRSGHGDRRS